MDVRKLEFGDHTFDVAIDKANMAFKIVDIACHLNTFLHYLRILVISSETSI